MHLFFIFTLICMVSAQQTLPYYESVPCGLHPGMAVYVKGKVPKDSNRFRVDFAFGKDEGADIAFHFNPRFKQLNELVINAFESGRWGQEERYKNPFQKDEYLEVIFIVTEAGYQIFVKGKVLHVFRHRIPPESVRFIKVAGDLELQSLNVTTAPATGNLTLPYYESVPNGLHPGMGVYVNGRVPKDSNRFRMDFAFGKDEGGNFGFHFNARFKESNELLINTVESGSWGKERRFHNPFQTGEHLEVLFVVTEAGYQTFVNRKLLYVFRHRIPPESVRFIKVAGELELQSLNVTVPPGIGNLTLPYYESVPCGLHPGMAVYVNGRVPKDSNRFRMNFAFAKHEGANIAFQFNAHFVGLDELVMNAFESSKWGKEERYQNPFWRVQHIVITFIVTEAGYQIFVKGELLYVFKHRIPPESVRFITIAGDLEQQSLIVTPAPVIGNLTLPYYESVQNGLHHGMVVYVNGRVPKDSNRFMVDFAFAKHEGADLAFHFNAIFKNSNELVINTLESGKWGQEERYQNPFRKGEHLEVIFIVTEAGYQIFVKGKVLYDFNHRIPPQRVRFIKVAGDLELQSLNVMAAPVIGNLDLPYYEKVPNGLHPGMGVYVNGRVPKYSTRFRVDFVFPKHEVSDIAFHFKARFEESNEFVINTFKSGRWGKEERFQNPFQKGEHLEVIFVVTEAGFQIFVNRKLLYVFMHRIPPESVRFIKVAGDLDLKSLNVKIAPLIGKLPVPYRGDIPGGLKTNRILTVRGFIPKNAARFEINFMAGQDIPLRINVHVKPWRAVVRNSFLNGNWGSEERNLTFNPFQPGQYFKLSIHCDNHEFKFYANEQPFFNYIHRYVPIKNIRTLEIDGDVTLSYIKY